jgi:hypothetical protein
MLSPFHNRARAVSGVPFWIITDDVVARRPEVTLPIARGEVAEWFKAAVLKTVEAERLPGVRIPSSPPAFARFASYGQAGSD